MFTQLRMEKLTSSLLSAALFLSVAAFASAPRAYADDDRSKCQHRIEKAEDRYRDAVRRHGDRSPDADRARHELNDERGRCYDQYHAWYNGEDRQWHKDRDWDRDDHDHDHDHDQH